MYSIVEGECIELEKVQDRMFAEKVLGDGVAFQFTGNVIYAPCDGIIELVAETKHAVGIKANNGAEFLIHIGLNTVNLGGEGFTALIKGGSKVKKGQPLIEFDRSFIEGKEIDLITMLVLTNSCDYVVEKKSIGSVNLNDFVFQIKPKTGGDHESC